MCYIIDDGAIKYMSAVIGICGTNFCTLCADSRKVVNHGNKWLVETDLMQKVFKVNDRVLVGATGIFDIGEEILDPLKVYSDHSIITLRMAYKAVLGYLEKNKYSHLMMGRVRNYLIGGKDNKENFCIYEIHLNAETGETTTTLRQPDPTRYNFAISCSLPFSLREQTEEYIRKVSGVISSSRTHTEMTAWVDKIIRHIASVDNTVGGDTQVVSVF